MTSSAKYSDHPLYRFRVALLISAAIGVFLSLISISGAYYGDVSGPFATALVFLFLSGLLCTFDLITYKIAKATDFDHEPKWPVRRYMYGDLVFALLLQWTFWIVISTLEFDRYRNGYGSNTLLHAYATLPVLASSYVSPTIRDILADTFSAYYMASASGRSSWLARKQHGCLLNHFCHVQSVEQDRATTPRAISYRVSLYTQMVLKICALASTSLHMTTPQLNRRS